MEGEGQVKNTEGEDYKGQVMQITGRFELDKRVEFNIRSRAIKYI